MREQDQGQSELMDNASSGDDAAFGRLAMGVQDQLYRFGLAHGLRDADASDAVQETLLRAYRGRASWKTGGHVMAWMCGIAMNVVREFHRRRHGGFAEGIDLEVLIQAKDQGESATEKAEARQRLSEALAKLPDRQREAVACRYLLEMDVKQTADAMQCAEGTVKAAVFAAIDNLRKAMGAPRSKS